MKRFHWIGFSYSVLLGTKSSIRVWIENVAPTVKAFAVRFFLLSEIVLLAIQVNTLHLLFSRYLALLILGAHATRTFSWESNRVFPFLTTVQNRTSLNRWVGHTLGRLVVHYLTVKTSSQNLHHITIFSSSLRLYCPYLRPLLNNERGALKIVPQLSNRPCIFRTLCYFVKYIDFTQNTVFRNARQMVVDDLNRNWQRNQF